VEKSLAKMPYPSKFVVIPTVVHIHDDAKAEEYVVLSTTLVVVEAGWSQLFSNCHQQGWLCQSLLMTCMANISLTCIWHGALHTSCAMVESTATMCVQNYAGSRVKSGSCWKCSSADKGDVDNSRTAFQLIHDTEYHAGLGDSWTFCFSGW